MRRREWKKNDRWQWGHNRRQGYLKSCNRCHVLIYLKPQGYGTWCAWESWVSGNAEWNEWIPHDCPAR